MKKREEFVKLVLLMKEASHETVDLGVVLQ